MFQLMRNTHLALGLAFFLVAAMFAFSSVVIIYRPWFPGGPRETNTAVTIEPALEPRAAARALMRQHGVRGDLMNVKAGAELSTFGIHRPGTHVNVRYSPSTGHAELRTRRFSFYETMVQLHVTHGFWHDFFSSTIWALLSLTGSIALLVLGATGIYLWYRHPAERTVGSVLIALGLVVPVAALVLSRV
ncbi:MAG: hypothetical protein IPM24_16120 [Bryobacterales bacterium]|nr:hypothetical protein [Bryobacterales bacterium]